MRDLKVSSKNILAIFDQASGSKLTLFYKTPSTEDRINYQRAIINQLTKTKDVTDVIKLQAEWGDKLLTGFDKGSFCLDGKIIASDTEDKDYYAGWRGVIKDTASDLLILLAETVIGKTNFVVKEEETSQSFFYGKSGKAGTSGLKKKNSNT